MPDSKTSELKVCVAESENVDGRKAAEELISKIESGEWDPENIEADQRQRDAMAAKGYYNAFNKVVESVIKVLNKGDAGKILSADLQTWYRQLFAPLLKVCVCCV